MNFQKTSRISQSNSIFLGNRSLEPSGLCAQRLQPRIVGATILSAFLFLSLGTTFAQTAAPMNDKCEDAVVVNDGDTAIFCTEFATTTDYFLGSEKIALAGATIDFYGIKRDVFYCYTASNPAAKSLTINILQSFPGMAIGVAKVAMPCDCTGSPTPVGVYNSCKQGPATSVTFKITPGCHYIIRVGGCTDQGFGMGQLQFICDERPSNNLCFDRDVVPPDATVIPYDLANAEPSDPVAPILSDVWFEYRPTCAETVTFTTCSTGAEVALTLYEGIGMCPTDPPIAEGVANCSAGTTGSELTAMVVPGVPYILRVGETPNTQAAVVGDIEILRVSTGMLGAGNDECDMALIVTDGTTLFDTTCATDSMIAQSPACDFFGSSEIENDVWFSYTANCTGQVRIDFTGSSFDTKAAAYLAPCDPAIPPIVCNDDFNQDLTSLLVFDAMAGVTYSIRVGGYNGVTGAGMFDITCGPANLPSNDNIAMPITITDGTTLFSNFGATTDGPEDCPCDPKKDLWYRYSPAFNGDLMVDTCGSLFDTVLGIYEEPPSPPILVSGDELACVDDSCDYQSEISVRVTAGVDLLIRVGGWAEIEGEGMLNVQLTPATQEFVRGDCNASDATDIADAITLVDFLFSQGMTPVCENSCDANDDDLINIADVISVLSSLFGTPVVPLPSPLVCGPDPTPGNLTCTAFPPCP